MEHPAIIVCEFAYTAIPAFATCLACDKFAHARRRRFIAPPMALAVVFSVYLFVLLHFTGAGTLRDAMRFGVDLNPCQMNLVPFVGFFEDAEGHALNVLLFVPLGLLVPMVARVRPGVPRITMIAATTSVAIEFSQLLNSRIADVDDLLMNVIGALIGYELFRCSSPGREGRFGEGPGVRLPAAMIVAAFLGRFLLYDEMGLAKMLVGF